MHKLFLGALIILTAGVEVANGQGFMITPGTDLTDTHPKTCSVTFSRAANGSVRFGDMELRYTGRTWDLDFTTSDPGELTDVVIAVDGESPGC